MKVSNLPDDYKKFPYIVARRVNGVLWYWGAYKNRNQANEAALAYNGITLESAIIERDIF